MTHKAVALLTFIYRAASFSLFGDKNPTVIVMALCFFVFATSGLMGGKLKTWVKFETFPSVFYGRVRKFVLSEAAACPAVFMA